MHCVTGEPSSGWEYVTDQVSATRANSLPLIIIVNITKETDVTITIAFSSRLVLQCHDGDDDGVEETFWRTREGARTTDRDCTLRGEGGENHHQGG